VDMDKLELTVHEMEMNNLPYYGFGIASFILALIEAAVKATRGLVIATDIARLLEIARGMVTAEVQLVDGVTETLAALAADYPLLLITKGDLMHQRDKVTRSGLAGYFVGVEVVSDKTPAVYREILTRRGVAPERFLMIGNSARSDILPVASLGGRAIHVPNGTSWVYDVVEIPDDLPGSVYRAERLSEVVEMIRRGLTL